MGTRSLLGYVNEDGTTYSQYMQFDGYPSVKGREFYENCIKFMNETSEAEENGKPTPLFFKRVQDFLNNYQYASGHSICANDVYSEDKWQKANCGQEYQYRFLRNGDFEFFDSIDTYHTVIPWELTRALVCSIDSHRLYLVDNNRDSLLAPFFSAMDNWNPSEPDDDGKPKDDKAPSISCRVWECLAFPDQKSHGWRQCLSVLVNGKNILKGMFYDTKPRRNEKKYTTKVYCEYLHVKKAKLDTIPALIPGLKNSDAKKLAERRLKGE